jgi:hypothetical protein
MTRRKPPDLTWESWIDRQVREAERRGEFDDLPHAGEPLPDLDKPKDEQWWIRAKLRSEGLSYAPPSLMLKRKSEEELELALAAESEAKARRIIEAINAEIREANRNGIRGPLVILKPYDVERVLIGRREADARAAR